MGLTLAVVTCGPQLEVALGGLPSGIPSLVRLVGGSLRSTLVLAAADLLLEDAGVGPLELETVAVCRGPGSFTGIRAGIATAQGLAAATGVRLVAFDSLLVQAARVDGGVVWSAQPGRRGEVYARSFDAGAGRPPRAVGEVRIVRVADAPTLGPWIAAEPLDLGGAVRARPARSAAEALLCLVAAGLPGDPLEPIYVEGPPIHRAQET